MDLELARQQWEDGRRRVERVQRDPEAYHRLMTQVEIVASELRGRLGQTFTLEELATTYDDAVEWARDALEDALPEDAPPPDTPTATDAAFHSYARHASDYTP